MVNPAGKTSGFHGRSPRLRKRSHPAVQIKTCGGNRAVGMNLAAAVLHTVADRFLVNIQSDVIHTLHRGSLLGVSESARSLSSAFVHQALLPLPIHSNLSVVICYAGQSSV